jgi:hypothetical protein
VPLRAVGHYENQILHYEGFNILEN